MGVTLDRIHSKGCLRDNEIELFLLQRLFLDESDERRISEHLSLCSECFRRFIGLQTFHDILSSELKKPISNGVKILVKGLKDQCQE